MIQRYSSRRGPLKDFLATQLQGARRYDRIAGFFSSSLLEVDEEGENEEEEKLSSIYPLFPEERAVLGRFLKILEENRDEEPKLRRVERILTTNDIVAGGWLSLGYIILSQSEELRKGW